MKILNKFINKLEYKNILEVEDDTIDFDFENKLKETLQFKMMLENTIIM